MKKIIGLFFVAFIVSCSEDDFFSSDLGKNDISLEIKVQENIATRSKISDENNALLYIFEDGDLATAYNPSIANVGTTLRYHGNANSFKGNYVNSLKDEVSVVFPTCSQPSDNGRIKLSLPHQDGTLQTLSSTSYQWGFTRLFMENESYVGNVYMNPLMAFCRFVFTNGGSELNDITTIKMSCAKGSFYKNRSLNLSSGSLEEGELVREITIHNIDGMNPEGGPVYISVFPSAFDLSFQLTDKQGYVYEGSLDEHKYIQGEYYTTSVEVHKVGILPETQSSDIIVCGISWARGNLIYDTNSFGNTKCQEHWFISPDQWKYPSAVDGYRAESMQEDADVINHFNWGVLGTNSLSNKLYANYYGDITGKMYIDRGCTQQTEDFESAEYGDLPYWATCGEYRLPTEEEMNKLFVEASYSFGTYTTTYGTKVYGFLFWDSEGDRTVETRMQTYTDADLNNALFLPAAGLREHASSLLTRVGACSYYWDGHRDSEMNQMAGIYQSLLYRSSSPGYGRAIRPVRNTNKPHKEEFKPYIEVGGTKWAKGNLQYVKGASTTNGFSVNWSIADNQWSYPDCGLGYGDFSIEQSPDAVYHFNWGVCGDNSLSQKLYANFIGDISGKMFKDRNCTQQTTDFSEAAYGDIAFWASRGKYRMPSHTEMQRLFTVCSYSHGSYRAKDGSLTYGFLFKNPNGVRVIETKGQVYTDYDMEHYLFLPAAGNREYNNGKMKRIGCCGYYWDSHCDETMEQISMLYTNLLWRNTSPSYGRTIRPVFNQ